MTLTPPPPPPPVDDDALVPVPAQWRTAEACLVAKQTLHARNVGFRSLEVHDVAEWPSDKATLARMTNAFHMQGMQAASSGEIAVAIAARGPREMHSWVVRTCGACVRDPSKHTGGCALVPTDAGSDAKSHCSLVAVPMAFQMYNPNDPDNQLPTREDDEGDEDPTPAPDTSTQTGAEAAPQLSPPSTPASPTPSPTPPALPGLVHVSASCLAADADATFADVNQIIDVDKVREQVMAEPRPSQPIDPCLLAATQRAGASRLDEVTKAFAQARLAEEARASDWDIPASEIDAWSEA